MVSIATGVDEFLRQRPHSVSFAALLSISLFIFSFKSGVFLNTVHGFCRVLFPAGFHLARKDVERREIQVGRSLLMTQGMMRYCLSLAQILW